jgi:hypothetical protein
LAAPLEYERLALDFAEEVDRISDPDQVVNSVQRVMIPFGLELFSIIAWLPSPKEHLDRIVLARLTPDMAEWLKIYEDEKYSEIDPIVRRLRYSVMPLEHAGITYGSEPRAVELRRRRRDFGFASGLSVPIFGPNGRIGYVRYAIFKGVPFHDALCIRPVLSPSRPTIRHKANSHQSTARGTYLGRGWQVGMGNGRNPAYFQQRTLLYCGGIEVDAGNHTKRSSGISRPFAQIFTRYFVFSRRPVGIGILQHSSPSIISVSSIDTGMLIVSSSPAGGGFNSKNVTGGGDLWLSGLEVWPKRGRPIDRIL